VFVASSKGASLCWLDLGFSRTLWLPKTNAGPSAVLCDEFYAGFLERGFDLCQRIEPNFQFAFHRLYSLNGLKRDICSCG